jgi:LmbE family N-acetylglucosaminyl deacetylase
MTERNENIERRRVALAIGAHPDDVEISCAGTLRLLAAKGFEIHIATMTLGDCGSKDHSADEIRRIRRREAESACALFGAAYHYAGSHDFSIFHDDAHNRRVTALLREVSPEVVLTHPPSDYISDHEMTSVLVRNACFYAPAPNYDTSSVNDASAIHAIPHLYYWGAMEGMDIYGQPALPQMWVSIDDQIEFKSQMLACHGSQREWLREQHGIDEYIESMRAWCRVRGREAAAAANRPIEYAEAFRQHLGHAYPHTNLLAEVLAENAVLREPDAG